MLHTFNRNTEIGPHALLRQMHAEPAFTDDVKTELVYWWKSVSSFDPDVEPEHLVTQPQHERFKEILGAASILRIQPGWMFPDPGSDAYDKQCNKWATRHQNLIRTLLDSNDPGVWSNLIYKYQDNTTLKWIPALEDCIKKALPENPFVQISNNLDLSLQEVIQPNNNQELISTTLDFNV